MTMIVIMIIIAIMMMLMMDDDDDDDDDSGGGGGAAADDDYLHDCSYRMVVNTLEYLHEFDGDQLVMANVSFPGSSQQVRGW